MELIKKPIINCHTHIFTGKNVPPHLAKSFLWWPFYKWLNTPLLMSAFAFWYKNRKYSPHFYKYKKWYKFLQRIIYNYKSFVQRHFITNKLRWIINTWLTVQAIIFLFKKYLIILIAQNKTVFYYVGIVKDFLLQNNFLFINVHSIIKWSIILFVVFFIKWGRHLIWFILKKMWKFLSLLPNKTTVAFMQRYLNIGLFANYKDSDNIFGRLRAQYEEKDTGFVILPMDMEYMGAGKPVENGMFLKQMEELAIIKKNHPIQALPFIFIDPRRIEEDINFLKFSTNCNNGKVMLEDCFIKDYIEQKNFNGFKIYPALGYYVFDEKLLLLWKYAADHQIPIMTHAIRGNIFYRGKKRKEWGNHPIIQQYKADGAKTMEPLLLPELKNIDFINNFTHPLNYLCLLEERLLRKIVSQSNEQIKNVFGYTNDNTALLYDFKHLKICFGHFGGDDEWEKYFEADRKNTAASLIKDNTIGIKFMEDANGNYTEGKLEEIWKDTDWYSIISSIMLQYENIYADISYIIHQNTIIPLLKKTLENNVLQKRVLFGTDFYVVRNHKSEKQMLAEIKSNLSEIEFDLIARENPRTFLKTSYYNPELNYSLQLI